MDSRCGNCMYAAPINGDKKIHSKLAKCLYNPPKVSNYILKDREEYDIDDTVKLYAASVRPIIHINDEGCSKFSPKIKHTNMYGIPSTEDTLT